MEEQKKSNRGGVRQGAGRKKVYVGGKRFAFNADRELTKVLNEQEDKTAFVQQCIQEHLERERAAQASAMPDLSSLGTVYAMGEETQGALPHVDVRVACGLPAEVFSDEVPMLTDLLPLLCQHTDSSYMVVAKGDSMIDANIQSGDLVIVDMSQRLPVSRKPMLCELNGGYTVKYVRHLSDGYWLQPANPTFADIPVEEEDDFKIWGVVTSVVHRF